uniref:CXADR like membrane protein n=1 Tax=Naja naja TaxID=35670 RepID=A0A8C6XPZ5_NAJNA
MSVLSILLLASCCTWMSQAQTEFKRVAEANVTLPCLHRLHLLEPASLDIEWLLKNSEAEPKVVITYAGGNIYHDMIEEQKGRVSFASNFLSGDASLEISLLQPSDSGQYTCKVKNAGQYEWTHITLKVLEKPSKPKCWKEGTASEGKEITLQCNSVSGTAPIMYTWQRVDTKGKLESLPPSTRLSEFCRFKASCRSPMNYPMSYLKVSLYILRQAIVPLNDTIMLQMSLNPAPQFILDLSNPAQIIMKNLTWMFTGSYQCTASNEAGEESCVIQVTVQHPPNVGIVAGAICGVMGVSLLIVLAVWQTIKKKEKNKYEEETPNEIREDAEAPKARLVKPGSSSLGSRSSHSGSSSTRSTENSASRSQQTLSTEATPHLTPTQHSPLEMNGRKIEPKRSNYTSLIKTEVTPTTMPAQRRAFQTV